MNDELNINQSIVALTNIIAQIETRLQKLESHNNITNSPGQFKKITSWADLYALNRAHIKEKLDDTR